MADGLDGGALNEEGSFQFGAGLFAGEGDFVLAEFVGGEVAGEGAPLIALLGQTDGLCFARGSDDAGGDIALGERFARLLHGRWH